MLDPKLTWTTLELWLLLSLMMVFLDNFSASSFCANASPVPDIAIFFGIFDDGGTLALQSSTPVSMSEGEGSLSASLDTSSVNLMVGSSCSSSLASST